MSKTKVSVWPCSGMNSPDSEPVPSCCVLTWWKWLRIRASFIRHYPVHECRVSKAPFPNNVTQGIRILTQILGGHIAGNNMSTLKKIYLSCHQGNVSLTEQLTEREYTSERKTSKAMVAGQINGKFFRRHFLIISEILE